MTDWTQARNPAMAVPRPWGALWNPGIVLGPALGLLVAYLVDSQGVGTAALVPVAILGTAAVVHSVKRPLVAVAVVGVLAPFVGHLPLRWPERGFTVVFDALVLLPLAALLLRKIVSPSDVRLGGRGAMLLWGFVIVALAQFLNPDSASVVVNLQGFRRHVLPMLLLLVGMNMDLQPPGRLRRLAWGCVAVGVPVAAWGLKQRFIGLSGVEQIHAAQLPTVWVGEVLRPFSTFGVPWAFAAYIAFVGILAVSLLLGGRTATGRVFAGALAALFGVTLVFTLMRGALAGYAVGLLLLAVAFVVRGRRRGLVVSLLLLALGCYAGLASFLAPSLHRAVGPDSTLLVRVASLAAPLRDEGMKERFATWQAVLPLAERYPLGLGLGTTGGVAARYEDSLRHAAIHSDNIYFAALVETGWPGAFLLLGVSVWVLYQGSRSLQRPRHGRDSWVSIGVFACLIMATLANLATPIAWEPGIAHLVWLASGIAVNGTVSRPRGRSS